MFGNYVLISPLLTILFYASLVKGQRNTPEDDIKKKVLEGYDPSLPPILFSKGDNYNFVHIIFMIFRIQGLDEKKGEFRVEGRFIISWTDVRLSWENKEVRSFVVSPNEVWKPMIYIYNGAEPEEKIMESLVVVRNTTAARLYCYVIKTSCIPNLRLYPFDKNVCDIMIAAQNKEDDFLFTDESTELLGYTFTRYMLKNPQWTFDRPKVYQKKIQIDSNIERNVLIYSFPIQRSMPLIPLGILTPCIASCLLFLTTFWMEAGSTLRAGLCVTSMLVSTSSLFTLSKILPASGSSTPIIVEYVSISMILSAISSVQTTVVSVFRRCEKLPPFSYTKIVSKIPSWCLFLMGIAPEKIMSEQLEQKFLFSELEDQERKNVDDKEENYSSAEQILGQFLVQSLWTKCIILFDRIMFYLVGVIFLLFVVSVVITE